MEVPSLSTWTLPVVRMSIITSDVSEGHIWAGDSIIYLM